MLCELCNQPYSVTTDVRWHPECWEKYQDFIRDDFLPLIRELAEEQPLMTLYAISPEFREEMESSLITEQPQWL